jgi:glutathione S-transferase
MTRLALREGSQVEFEANSRQYNYDYFLADDIYPMWQMFVKPKCKKQNQFHNAQAVARNDVERACGILQPQFSIVRGPAMFWYQ